MGRKPLPGAATRLTLDGMTTEHIATADRVRYTVTDDGIADVRMVRADKMNALDEQMFDALVDVGKELAADNRVRVVVLSGEGRAFCAGLDLDVMESLRGGAGGLSASNEYENLAGIRLIRAQAAPYVWTAMPVPVIAAVHGVAMGGGFQIALAADIRIVHPATKLSIMETKWGIIPDMTGTQLLAGLVRRDIA